MSINVNMKKIAIVGIVLLIVGAVGYNWYSDRGVRKAEAEYETLVRFADRQAVEIAIIEQSVKLQNYQQQMAAAQKAVQPIAPVDPKVEGE